MPQKGTTMAKRTKQSKSGQSNHTESRPQSRSPRATERREETWSPVMEGIIPLPPSLTVNAAAPSRYEEKGLLFPAIRMTKIIRH